MINVFPYNQSEALSENEIHPRKGGTELSTTESGSLTLRMNLVNRDLRQFHAIVIVVA